MTDGLQIKIKVYDAGFFIGIGDDNCLSGGYSLEDALQMWLDEYGEKYGLQPEPTEFTIVLPWADKD